LTTTLDLGMITAPKLNQTPTRSLHTGEPGPFKLAGDRRTVASYCAPGSTCRIRAFTKMWNGLVDGDPSGQILTAWIAKEELRALFATARSGGVRHDVAHRLTRFYAWCAGPGATIPSCNAWPPPSTPGGLRSWGSSPPG